MVLSPRFTLNDPSLLLSTGWINDAPARSGTNRTPFEVQDPATGEVWARVESMDAADADAAIQAATDAFPAYSALPARTRARLLLEFDRLVRENKEDLATLVVMEAGKTLAEARAEVDYAATYSWIMAGEAERIQGDVLKANENPSLRFFTIKQPIGPVGLLCPWNFPIAIALRKIATALAAGCTVVIKPSPETPTTTLALALLAQRAGFPKGVVNVVTASSETTPEVGQKFCEDKRLKKISFTGSTNVGKLLAAQSASSLKKLTLELGGNGSFIVFEDADLEQAADALVANKFRNAGQVCTCANRIFVQASVIDKFSELVKARVAKLNTGHGLDAGVTTGALTTERGAERAVGLVADAIKNGGTLHAGGKRIGTGFLFEPTLITGASKDAKVYKEEIFGPILSIYAFETEDEVLKLANATDMGLTNYVFSQNIGRAWRCYEKLESGTVAINTAIANAAESPFGGIKESGSGKEGGLGYGVDEFLIIKSAAMTV
ncbi:Succinate-semialdehyde dehydrogenase [NADP(+)] [Vanrija pseudolonga]|uniref:Succinate-semialdehyde dehydrogenase [NADP(+)] n=1 Tax=Vanrija pseudolonga TaxID=143232 RepID=A0AAF0YB12_9TREE|nr:Succinate-semialdehyde dehydrogenase [NADP(+)] [Vanrija pseudolonga]